LGPNINTTSVEQCPHLAPDGHTLMFATNRPGVVGGNDLYVSHRRNQRDDFGWDVAVTMGGNINSVAADVTPGSYEDPSNGNIVLYFASTRTGGAGGQDIYSSVMRNDGSFAPATLVPELSTSASENFPTPQPNGLEMWLTSDRPGALGGNDLWIATRASTSANWSAPVNLGMPINSAANEVGTTMPLAKNLLIFHSDRPGGQGGSDLYVTTRTRGVATSPVISTNGVVNASTYAVGPLVANSLVSIFGINMASVTALGEPSEGRYPTNLFGTRVSFITSRGSVDAPLLYVSPLQVNIQVPIGLPPGPATLTVTIDGAASPPHAVTIAGG
jgi:hypothetical protein